MCRGQSYHWGNRKCNLVDPAFPLLHPSSLMAALLKSGILYQYRSHTLFFLYFPWLWINKPLLIHLEDPEEKHRALMSHPLKPAGWNEPCHGWYIYIHPLKRRGKYFLMLFPMYLLDDYLLGIADEILSRCESVGNHWLQYEMLVTISNSELVVSL